MKIKKDERTLIYRAQLGLAFVLLILAFFTANSLAGENEERVLKKSMKPTRPYSLIVHNTQIGIMRQPDFVAFQEMGYNKGSKRYVFRYLTKNGTEKVEYLQWQDPSETKLSKN